MVSQFFSLDVTQIKNHAEYGYTLEVDVDYPSNLHNTHDKLPFLLLNLCLLNFKVKILLTILESKICMDNTLCGMWNYILACEYIIYLRH